MKKNVKAISISVLGILLILTVIIAVAPKQNQPYNIHNWALSDGSAVTYYEMRDGHKGTTDIYQYLILKGKDSEEKYLIRIGGSNKALELRLTNNIGTVMLLGRTADENSLSLIAALDIKKKTFMNRDRMKRIQEKNELTEEERELVKNIYSGTDSVIREVKEKPLIYP